MKYRKHIATLMLLLSTAALMVVLITNKGKGENINAKWERGVYYWRTTFQLDSIQRHYLDSTGTDCLHIRFFDVNLENGRTVPVATISGLDSVPGHLEVIPTVFITNEVLENVSSWAMDEEIDIISSNIAERLLNMISYHEIANVHEVHLDCDWTISTEAAFFLLCSKIGNMLHEEGIRLSSTLRLWQLKRDVPPVDRVVLMLYNTGDFRSINTRNSILDIADVRIYLGSPISYPLPLDIALPRFSWDLCYNFDGTFKGILHGEEVPPCCTVRHEEVTSEQLDEVMQLVKDNLHTVNSNPKTIYFSL